MDIEKELRKRYKSYVAYFNSGAIHGDRPLTWEHWSKGVSGTEERRRLKRKGW